MSQENIKVRFAPSPTGYMHIGNARIAIINYLFAKKNNGKFLFRIDDTDLERSKKEYENAIREDLAWLGICYDETFKQSERLDRYKEILDKLIAKGVIYKCFETSEELEYKRRLALSKGLPPVYDRSSLKLSEEEKSKIENANVPVYWRFKLPDEVISWHDMVLGDVSYKLSSLSDPVVMKGDGSYLYTFSSVIDDIDSCITHIIRGQDHVTNTAVQIAMFDEIFGSKYNITFAHLSLLVNKDGSQFSKRLGSLNLADIRKQGVDSMSICDLMASLGSSLDVIPFSKLDDLIQYFDITKFSTNSPKFDIEDILKLNKKILHSKKFEDFENMKLSREGFELIHENLDSYNDIFVWENIFSKDFLPKYRPLDEMKNVIITAIELIQNINEFSQESAEKFLKELKDKTGASGRSLYVPIRMSLCDIEHGPNMKDFLTFLGRDQILNRLQKVLQ